MAVAWGIAKFGRSASRTVDFIIATKPPYRDIQRSWRALGYMGEGKPAEVEFRGHVEQLWQDLDLQQFADRKQLKRAHKARRYILAAIDAIGYYNSPRFSASDLCPELNLTHQDSSTNRPYGHWAALPAPLSLQEYTRYARRPARRESALREDQYAENPLRAHAPQQLVDVPDVYRNQWQRYHRYYNFGAVGGDGGHALFRALPVPRNQWSLWHSIAYQVTDTQDTPGSIHSYLDVKASIWLFFNRNLRRVDSIRHRAHVVMQLKSRFADPLWGELSILRSFCRNEEDAGPPAYPSEGPFPTRTIADRFGVAGPRQPEGLHLLRSILQVISEYYSREVILFYPSIINASEVPIPYEDGQLYNDRLDPRRAQDASSYHYMVAGSNNDDYDNQILLATDDMLHFDPVVFAEGPQRRGFDTSNRYGDRRYVPMPWTERNYEGLPHSTPQEVRDLNRPSPLAVVPAIQAGGPPGADFYGDYFKAKRDVPGLMPTLPQLNWCMQNWDADRYDYGAAGAATRQEHIDSMAPADDAYQICRGPLLDGVRPLESKRAHDGARMILQALDSGKDGVLIARSHQFFLEGDFQET